MLTKMSTVLLDSPSNTTSQVEVTARAVAGLTQRPDELSLAAQVLQKWNVPVTGATDALSEPRDTFDSRSSKIYTYILQSA